MSKRWNISRRAFLGGAGAMLSLPLLEQMSFGAGKGAAREAAAGPKNFIVWHFPTSWTPTPGAIVAQNASSGALTAGKLGPVLGSFVDKGLLGDALIVTNVRNAPGYDNKAGDHARGCGAMLTCQQPQVGTDLVVGPSLDHVIAAAIGEGARLPSMQLATNGYVSAGSCDSGYPCPNMFYSSWSAPGVPAPGEPNPGKAFDRMFAGFDPNESTAEAERRARRKKSVLDYALEQSNRLKSKLNPRDQQKLDQYFTGIRDFETRLGNAGGLTCTPGERPSSNPADPQEHIRLQNDLSVLALQCGVTPVIHFAYENTVSGKQHTFLKTADGQTVTDDWHIGITHHDGNAFKIAEQQAVNTWLVSQFADLAAKLKAIPLVEGGNLLDHTLMMGMSDMGDQAHNHSNMRPLFLGGSALGIKTGQIIVGDGEIRLANVYMGVMKALGMSPTNFGDSTGTLSLV